MGEHQRKSRGRAEILKTEPRCIYCANRPTTIEHMPPISMFRDRDRVSGMEFASCQICNTGTRAADEIAVLMAHILPFGSTEDWQMATMQKMIRTIEQHVPGFHAEFLRPENTKDEWILGPKGIHRRVRIISADGPILKRHLAVFSAKMGMALYREHIGIALPCEGAVYSRHFLNAGLSLKSVEAMLNMMPLPGELKMGKRSSKSQFAYRYNTDQKSIVAALVGFHGNLHCLVIATSEPDTYGPAITGSGYPIFISKPGTLVKLLEPESS